MNIQDTLRSQRNFFATGATLDVDFRKKQLKKLRDAIVKHKEDIIKALYADLRKGEFEAYATEIGFVLVELDEAIHNVERWARPRSVSTPLFHFKASSYILPDPLGSVLIIAPWNYPFQLLVMPLIGAMAAGNTVFLKPSELAPATSAITAKIFAETFDTNYIACVEGGVEESKALLDLRWDYIFFTGGTEVGRIVYMAAAKHLTPVTLELGGKSPCVVDKDTDIDMTARRIVWGKYINAGQTCIAPDYVLVHNDVKDKLIEGLRKYITAFYGEKTQESNDYCRIINDKHFNRLKSYLADGLSVIGGETNEADLFISPTVLVNVKPDSKIMQEEIFGPILPIIGVDSLEEAQEFITHREKPLALYIFSRYDNRVEKLLKNTSSGGVCVNDTVMHIGNPNLPFGGVGQSGIGAYHSRTTFDLFSHQKSVLHKSFLVDLPVRYAPYKLGINTLETLMKWTLK